MANHSLKAAVRRQHCSLRLVANIPALKDKFQIVPQRWALQQKVAKGIADKRCSVAGLLPLKT